MNKKQTIPFYFISIFFLSWFGGIQSSNSQNVSSNLMVADSLFKEKKYTESFEIFKSIVEIQSKASPRMLLKMAFIKEGLGDYSNALYYLNLYYLETSDKKARTKMKEIASEQELSGFEVNDSDFFIGLARKFYWPINIVMMLIVFGLLVNMIIVKRKSGTLSFLKGLSFFFILGLLYFSVNYGLSSNSGIVIANHSYIMSGPSAGADLIDVVKKGHRLKMYEEKGPWVEVEWNGNKGFVRIDKLKKIG